MGSLAVLAAVGLSSAAASAEPGRGAPETQAVAGIAGTTGPPATRLRRRCRFQTVNAFAGKKVNVRLACRKELPNRRVVFQVRGGGRGIRRSTVLGPKHGRLGLISQKTGIVRYVPKSGFGGRDRFSFAIRVPGHGLFKGTVVARVTKPPPAPRCASGSVTVPYRTARQISLVCAGLGPLRYQVITPPSLGTVGPVSSSGSVTYTPAGQAVGSDRFVFRAIGPGGKAAGATMTVTVLPPPAPTCAAGSATTRVDTPVGLTIACSGPDLRYVVVAPPLHGELGAIDPATGAVTYTPSPGWFSPDDPPKADSFQIAAANRGGLSATQTVTVTVLPDAPSCDDEQASTRIDQAVTVQLPCDDAQTELSFQVVDPPDHGTLGPIDPRTGAVSYTPDAGWFSPGPIAAPVPDRFTFRASNTGGTSPVATASVTVVPAPPSCDPLDAEVDHDTPRDLQAQCATQGGAPQRYELISGLDPSTSGTLTQDPGFPTNGSLRFSPAPGFFTAPGDYVTFAFRAVNAGGAAQLITATLQVDEATPTCDDFDGRTAYETSLAFTIPCDELNGGPQDFSITQQPPSAQGQVVLLNAATGAARFDPAPGYFVPSGGARVRFDYQAKAVVGGTTSTGVGFVDVLPPVPSCQPVSASTRYVTPVTVHTSCSGPELAYRVVTGPSHGTLGAVDQGTGQVTYTPAARFAGSDAFTYEASNRAGASAPAVASLSVRQWEMRTLGDSVTAAFGYFANGGVMPLSDLLSCKPSGMLNDRCSSNSSNGPGYNGSDLNFTADYGLGNNVGWPAQFANTVQGGGQITAPTMFRNEAVTGSAPSDWLAGGTLNSTLNAIVAEQPDLIAFTLGANPLLSDVLLTARGEACAAAPTVSLVRRCIQPLIDAAHMPQRLQQIYTGLLQQTTRTQVVAMDYHLTIPAVNLFSAWQLEVMSDMLNENIAAAVSATRASVTSSQSARLQHVQAASGPSDTNPVKLPRFMIGVAPTVHDDWKGRFNCGWWYPDVDGPSNQSTASQAVMAASRTVGPFVDFCVGQPWILSADSGIHPNSLGYQRFASALTNNLQAKGLIPPLP